MTITLNVLITLTGGEKVFSVWSEPIPGITWIEIAVGAGFTITDAVDDWYDKLPSTRSTSNTGSRGRSW